MAFMRLTPPPTPPAQPPTPSGPPESAILTSRLAEVNHHLDQLETQRASLQDVHTALNTRYDAAVVADVQGQTSEDPAAIRAERDRTGDKLAGNERLRTIATAERDALQSRLNAAHAIERREARLRAFEEAKTRTTGKTAEARQAFATACRLLGELNTELDPFYGEYQDIGGPAFAGGVATEVGLGYTALQQAGWHYVAGRGGVAGLEVVPLVPPKHGGVS